MKTDGCVLGGAGMLAPERCKRDGETREERGDKVRLARQPRRPTIAPLTKLEGLEDTGLRVHEPVVGHPVTGKELRLLDSIPALRPRGENLHDEVGHTLDAPIGHEAGAVAAHE